MEHLNYYNRVKAKCELPVANITYILLKGKCYDFFSQPISFREAAKEETLNMLKDIVEKDGFYAFADSDKGRKFISENKESIAKLLMQSYFGYPGFGKVCKN